MTNYPWTDVAQLDDIESLGNYRDLLARGLMDEEEGLAMLRERSRDNARTPMQWDAGFNAGFSEGRPWLPVNPNHMEINAAEQLARPDSVFHYYRRLIALRKELDVIVHGRYELLEPEHPALFVYTRTLGEEKLLVVCSFSEEPQAWEIPAAFREAERLIGNYPESAPEGAVRPWEAFVLRRREAGKAAPEAEA